MPHASRGREAGSVQRLYDPSMQFGTFIPQGWRLDLAGIDTADHWATTTRVAKQAEALGFESIWVFDHFHTVPVPTQEPTYEAWTLMASLAAATDTIRLGQMCTCNGYRNPAYLAKVASSIDAISGGRVDMGIGGGWYDHEYNAYGYPFPKPSVRLGELDEAVQIMQKMWTEEEASFTGKHYTIDGAICQPKPVQDPSIPMWIAGGGEQLTLRTAARYADYTNFGGPVETFVHKSQVLEQHCENQGTDYESITRSKNFTVLLAEDEADLAAKKERVVGRYESILGDAAPAFDRWFSGPDSAVGTPDQVAEQIKAFEDVGMEYVILFFPEMSYDDSAMQLFSREVMTHFEA